MVVSLFSLLLFKMLILIFFSFLGLLLVRGEGEGMEEEWGLWSTMDTTTIPGVPGRLEVELV